MATRAKNPEINILTSPPSQILTEEMFISRSPKKREPTLSLLGNDRRTSLSPTLIDPKSPFASPKAQRLETLGNTNLSKKSLSYLGDQNLLMKTLPGDDVSKMAKKPPMESIKETSKPRYDYSSQLLMYIPANINELTKSTAANTAFNSFNQLSQSVRNSHQKLLEGMLKEYKQPSSSTMFESTKSHFKSFDTMDSVKRMLELNKLQKKSYSKQIEVEKRHLVLPLIQKVQENESKTKRMPHVKKLPSRNVYNGNNMDAIIESPLTLDKGDMYSSFDGYGGTFNTISDMGLRIELGSDRMGSNRSGSMDDRTTDKPFGQVTYKVYWNYNFLDKNMWRPYAREGHTLTTVGRQVILYGGISNYVMDEIIVYDPTKGGWNKPQVYGDIPLSGRHGHSACEYKRTLIIFGGEHEFNPTLNFRECLNDVYMYIPDKNEWKYLKSSNGMINSRRHHAAAVVDNSMYVYGGITNEGNYIKDVWSFNLKTCTWNQLDAEGDKENGIASHTMSSCVMTRTGSSMRDKDRRIFEEGLYVFGGKDSEGKILGVLKMLPIKSKEYKWKYLATKGVGPTARYNHTTLFYEPLAILLVYGGRNDSMFEATRDICLKDLRILSLETLTWTSTSSFGDVPQTGRYHHAVACYGTKMLIFGGVMYQSYANDEVKSVELNPGEVHRLVKEQQAMDGVVTEVKKGRKMPMASILKDRTEALEREKILKESKSVSINLRSFQPIPKDEDLVPLDLNERSPTKNNGKAKVMKALSKIMSP